MKVVVSDFADRIKQRAAAGRPLTTVEDEIISLNICRSCINVSSITGFTLWDHPRVNITNVHNIDLEIERFRASR